MAMLSRTLPEVGEVIAGKYRIVRKLGEGGMGVVFEAEHVRIRQRMAIKMLLPQATRVLSHSSICSSKRIVIPSPLGRRPNTISGRPFSPQRFLRPDIMEAVGRHRASLPGLATHYAGACFICVDPGG